MDQQQWSIKDNPPLEALYLDECQALGETAGMVVMKGAQTRASVYTMLKTIWRTQRWTMNQGYYLPDQALAFAFSGERFAPMADQIPALVAARRADDTDNKQIRRMGDCLVFFQWMGGRASKEAIPLDALVFDEVHAMTLRDVEIAMERLSGNDTFRWMDFISTAGYPDADIDRLFRRRSDRRRWHSACGCPEGVVLADFFAPDGIACIKEEPGGGAHYRCPRCNRRVEPLKPADVGEFRGWVPEVVSGAEWHGYHFPQTISKTVTAIDMLRAFRESTDLDNYFQRKVGVPYVSPDKILVTPEILEACTDRTLEWERAGTNCLLGADQMGGSVYAVVKRLLDNGKTRLVHLAVFEGPTAFDGLYNLMRAFDVSVGVVDLMINYNEACKLALAFPGRVFLASYQNADRMVRWLDRDGPADPRQEEERTKFAARVPWLVHLDRTKVLDWSLRRYAARANVIPNPRWLVTRMVWEGTRRPVYLCEEVFFRHLQSLAREKEAIGNELEGKYRVVFKKIGLDPHFAHANAYCDVAGVRQGRVSKVTMVNAG